MSNLTPKELADALDQEAGFLEQEPGDVYGIERAKKWRKAAQYLRQLEVPRSVWQRWADGDVPTPMEVPGDGLPESLKDPMEVLERGRELLNEGFTSQLEVPDDERIQWLLEWLKVIGDGAVSEVDDELCQEIANLIRNLSAQLADAKENPLYNEKIALHKAYSRERAAAQQLRARVAELGKKIQGESK